MTQTKVEMSKLEKAMSVVTSYTSKPVITTLIYLVGKSDMVKARRGSGHTTRQVNFAVDKLFEGYAVICLDHREEGFSDRDNRGLFERVLRRLQNEHPGLVSSEYLGYNQLYGFIYLKT